MKVPMSPVSDFLRQVLVQAGRCSDSASEWHERPWLPPWRGQEPEEQAVRNWAQSEAAGPALEANSLSTCKIEPYAMKSNLIGRKGGGRVSKINSPPKK